MKKEIDSKHHLSSLLTSNVPNSLSEEEIEQNLQIFGEIQQSIFLPQLKEEQKKTLIIFKSELSVDSALKGGERIQLLDSLVKMQVLNEAEVRKLMQSGCNSNNSKEKIINSNIQSKKVNTIDGYFNKIESPEKKKLFAALGQDGVYCNLCCKYQRATGEVYVTQPAYPVRIDDRKDSKLAKVCLTLSLSNAPAERQFSAMKRIKSSTRNRLSQPMLNWLLAIISNSEDEINDVDAELISKAWLGEPHRFWQLKLQILEGYNNVFDGSDSDQPSSVEESDSIEVETDEEDDMSDSLQEYDEYIESLMQKDSEQQMKPE
ncbi:MAG: hypothetical protein EZS28_005620 [Streblomastix strix]|uniref:HAT C-terminal dimerisation domain-containing protein n=1 Tax=Streblomastix strix TaxID=222440 RepID=A0A5J4WV96_9EUKA|nr:MAG: hypothetical protein EZS28_005620 [Streblomastix strix]